MNQEQPLTSAHTVIESYYYAYRATGDTKYQDWAWDAFLALNATCRTGSGFSSIADVNTPGGGEKLDLQESFFFAEVMKYSYLIQAPVSYLFLRIPFPFIVFGFGSEDLELIIFSGCRFPSRLQWHEPVRLQYGGAPT